MKIKCRLYPCRGSPKDVFVKYDKDVMSSIHEILGVKGFRHRHIQDLESFTIKRYPRSRIFLLFEAWETLPDPLVYNKSIPFMPGNVLLCIETEDKKLFDYDRKISAGGVDNYVKEWSDMMISRRNRV
jgi:hypothetical protein